MSTKQISRIVVLVAVVISLVTLLVKLIQGTAGLVGSLFNLILGIVVVIALVAIVIWMFAYAKKMRKKSRPGPSAQPEVLSFSVFPPKAWIVHIRAFTSPLCS